MQPATSPANPAGPTAWGPEDPLILDQVTRHVRSQITAGELPDPSVDEQPERHRFLRPLRDFLLAQRSTDPRVPPEIADCIAAACMGSHHLWQDLGLSGRPQVSRLMQIVVPRVFEANVRNLRWKRHLFLCLGATLGLDELRPPRCDGCDDFNICVGAPPDTQTVVTPIAVWPPR